MYSCRFLQTNNAWWSSYKTSTVLQVVGQQVGPALASQESHSRGGWELRSLFPGLAWFDDSAAEEGWRLRRPTWLTLSYLWLCCVCVVKEMVRLTCFSRLAPSYTASLFLRVVGSGITATGPAKLHEAPPVSGIEYWLQGAGWIVDQTSM